jgi:integrase
MNREGETMQGVTDRLPSDQTIPIPWDAFITEIESLWKPPMVAPATEKKINQVIRELNALGVTNTAELTPPMIARYIASRPPDQSAYTLRGMLGTVRTICSYAEQMGYVRISPFRLRRLSRWVGQMPSPGNGKKRHNTRAEIKAVWDLAAKDVETREGWAQWRARRTQVAFAMAALMGMRKNEILRTQIGDVDVASRIIRVRPHGKKLKTLASAAPLPIPVALLPIITSWLAHRMDCPYGYPLPKECPWLIPTNDRKAPWVSGSAESRPIARLRDLAKRAGVEDMTWQMLRRSCATHLEAHGLGRALIKRILRHTEDRVSEEFYSEADVTNLTAAVEDFSFDR